MYRLYIIKRRIEDVFIFPFVLLGRMIAARWPLKKEYRVFFFFPFYATGGAEKVHSQIAQAAGGPDSIIFFTRKSKNDHLLDEFRKSGCDIRDISVYTDNKWLYFLNLIYRGVISGYINRQAKAKVFNGQCNFAYKMSPWISKKHWQYELIHSFNTFAPIRIPFLAFYEKQIMISHKTIGDYQEQYRRINAPGRLTEKILYIPNGIVLPAQPARKSFREKVMTVLYVGRGTAEKRVHLVASIAKAAAAEKLPFRFVLAGDVKSSIPQELQRYAELPGVMSDQESLSELYLQSDFLVITSRFEGFPLVVMEAMSYGLIILSTPVGDIPRHVKENENGFLIHGRNETEIINNAVVILKDIACKPESLSAMSEKNIQYAANNFGIEQFRKNYRSLLN